VTDEEEDSLIEQLRAYGISLEDLEGLIRGQAEQVEGAGGAREGQAPPPFGGGTRPGAFDPLNDQPSSEQTEISTSAEVFGGEEVITRSAESTQFDADRLRDIARAKEAAADIRASAVKLVTEKLQAAEDEVMAMRAKAAEDVSRLRKETSRVMLARLKEAEQEADLLRRAAREENRQFWEAAYREFSNARTQMAQVRAQLGQFVTNMTDAVSSVEAAATSIAEMCARRLAETVDEHDYPFENRGAESAR